MKEPIENDIQWLDNFMALENQQAPRKHLIAHWQEILAALNQNPTPLINFIEQRDAKRVGFYFEALISFAIQHAYSLSLIKEHIQLNHNKNTLGEIDFLIRDNTSGECIHLETAIKFYLKSDPWFTPENPYQQWLGPMVKDRLDLKLNKLIHHQVQITQHPDYPSCENAALLPKVNKRAVLMTGYLFNNQFERTQNYWLTQKETPDHLEDNHSRYQIAVKPFWLCCPNPTTQTPDIHWLTKHQLIAEINNIIQQWNRPVLVFQNENLDLAPNQASQIPDSIKRFFIVPDNWKGLSPPN
jgi:hypothetical protein